jgi:hypothetical protein
MYLRDNDEDRENHVLMFNAFSERRFKIVRVTVSVL